MTHVSIIHEEEDEHYIYNRVSNLTPFRKFIFFTATILEGVGILIIKLFCLFCFLVITYEYITFTLNSSNVLLVTYFDSIKCICSNLFFYNYISADVLIFFYIFECLILVFSIFFINFLGTKGFFMINMINSFLILLVFLLLFFRFNIFNELTVVNIASLMKLSVNESIGICLLIDSISYNFCLLTLSISLCVYVYAFSYMRNELNIINFFALLKGFVLSMVLLLLAGNWVTLLLGWELIGVTSFLLINFWSNKITTLKSAFKAFSFNKVSDCFLIICFLIIQYFSNSFLISLNLQNFLYLYKTIWFLGFYFSYCDILLFCLIIAAFCKSAQFGFHFWLPDSMEAPVPASALIHSATLVSAGIYLLLRFIYLFPHSSFCSNIFIIMTSFTAFFGALVASFQTDVKKILAYSTISHCGFLMVSLYYANAYVTLIYLMGHGFYKSLSFMCVGNIIQFNNNYQDFRRSGNYANRAIFEFFTLFICIFNLSGFPFFINFFIKHFLLLNIDNLNFVTFISFLFTYLAAFCGIFYSSRMFYNIFLGFKKNHHSFYKISTIERVSNKYFFLIPLDPDRTDNVNFNKEQSTSPSYYYNNYFYQTSESIYHNTDTDINPIWHEGSMVNDLPINYDLPNKTNNLAVWSIFSLFILNIFIFYIFLTFFFDQLYSFINISIFFKNFLMFNLNFFTLKVIFFFIFITIVWLYTQFKKINLFELQYVWIIYMFILIISII